MSLTAENQINSFDDNIEKYNIVKETLFNNLIQQTKIIILYGRGCNGKTYLTNECIDLLRSNDYFIDQEIFIGERGYKRLNANNFERRLQNLPKEKALLHFPFDPFIEWNIAKPDNVCVISMDHISFKR
jgi:hypothetical protein